MLVKRTEIIRRLRKASNAVGVEFEIVELTDHIGIVVSSKRSTLGRHAENDDVTARKFFDQYAEILGKGWWR
jgi:DNA-directed RNA polymerase specialized sigma subunit